MVHAGAGCPNRNSLSRLWPVQIINHSRFAFSSPRLDLELYPYLPQVRVSITSAGDYMTLLSGRAA